ncbi:MAG: hypothetical protein Q9225_004999 [Loekoesia sp. 1 TL-2023]
MSGTKRKQSSGSAIHNGSFKKQKHLPEPVPKTRTLDSDLEAETDSDPIIESDTTEHSGDDDGISWPSAEENDARNVPTEDDLPESTRELSKESTKRSKRTKAQAEDIKSQPASSREAHAKQKVLAQERKAAKPNADSIARSKKLWERLRRKSHVPLDERKKLVAELFDIITSHVKDFVLKHDSVRVIQTAIKYANLDQQRMIAKELKGEYRGLAESRYAKFLLGKLLVHGDKEIRDMLVPEFYGHVRRLIKHPEASWILDDIYRGAATPLQKAIILREWYGAEFAIFKAGGKGPMSGELKKILQDHPEKRKPIMHALHDIINLLVQKKTTGFTMLHDAMLQYLLNIQPNSEEMTEFIELLKGDEEGDLLKNLAFTKSGARIVCLALAYGNAKDRKQILRVYKNTIETLAYDANGHQVILAAYDVVDDTVLTTKSIFPELVGKTADLDENQTQALLNAVTHLNARMPIVYPFAGKSKSILRNEDIDILDEIHRIRTMTSKKDPDTRRKELLTHLSPPLLSLIAHNAETLVQSSFGCQFITEVMLSAVGDREPASKAIIALTQSGIPEVKEALATPSAGRMLKTLVQGGRFNPKIQKVELADPPLIFHGPLYASLEAQGQVLDWATGGNSFVIVGLLEAEGFGHKEPLLDILRKERKKLEMAASPGVEREGEAGKKGEKIPAGNKGAQLLVTKLDEG